MADLAGQRGVDRSIVEANQVGYGINGCDSEDVLEVLKAATRRRTLSSVPDEAIDY